MQKIIFDCGTQKHWFLTKTRIQQTEEHFF